MNDENEHSNDHSEEEVPLPEMTRLQLKMLLNSRKKKVVLAQELGVTRGTLDSWLNGKTKSILSANLQKVRELARMETGKFPVRSAKRRCFIETANNGDLIVCETISNPQVDSLVFYNGEVGHWRIAMNDGSNGFFPLRGGFITLPGQPDHEVLGKIVSIEDGKP